MRLFVLALFAGLLFVPLVPAAESEPPIAPLPSARCCMAGFAYHGSAYVVGGRTDDWQIRDEILRYDPVTRNFTLDARLPAPRHAPGLALTPYGAFLFGGHDAVRDVDSILRFDPASRESTTMTARLPKPLRGVHAAWDGRILPEVGCPAGCVYLFGGIQEGGGVREENRAIFRYDPSGDRLTTLRSSFATFGDAGPAFLHDGAFFVIGASRNMSRFDPVGDVLAATFLTFPHATQGAAFVWDGAVATLVGGLDGSTASAMVQRYDAAAGFLSTISMEKGVHGAAAVSLDGRVHVFGGLDGAWQDTDRVFALEPTPLRVTPRGEPTRPAEPHPMRPPEPYPYPPGQPMRPPEPYPYPPGEPMSPTPITWHPASPPTPVHVDPYPSWPAPWYAGVLLAGFFGVPLGGLVWLLLLR